MADDDEEQEKEKVTWATGLCGCWSLPSESICDWGWACTGNVAPCYLFMLEREKMLTKAEGEKWFLLSRKSCSLPIRGHAAVHACCCVCCFPCVGAHNRKILRESRGIEGNCFGDLLAHMCCLGLSLAQEMRELEANPYNPQGYKNGTVVPVPVWRKLLRTCWPLKRREVRLRKAAMEGKIEECRDLLGQGCRVNCQDLTQKTPLLNAAYAGHTDCCVFLLENGAYIHHRDRSGSTPLLKAVQMGHSDTMVKLWEMGAEVNIKDSYGKSPLDYAAGPTEEMIKSIMGIKEEKVLTVQDLIQASMKK